MFDMRGGCLSRLQLLREGERGEVAAVDVLKAEQDDTGGEEAEVREGERERYYCYRVDKNWSKIHSFV